MCVPIRSAGFAIIIEGLRDTRPGEMMLVPMKYAVDSNELGPLKSYFCNGQDILREAWQVWCKSEDLAVIYHGKWDALFQRCDLISGGKC